MARLVQFFTTVIFAVCGSNNAFAVTLPSVPGFSPILGQGYDSSSGQLRQVCITGDVAYAGANESSLELGFTKTADEVKADVTATLNTGIDAFVIAAEAEAELSSIFASTLLENRYYTSAFVRGKKAILTNPRLTDAGKRVFSSRDAATVRSLCGDSYVNEVGLGVSFVFSLSLKHSDLESKNRVKTTYKIKLPFKTLKKTKEKAWNVDASHTDVRFDAVQFGGSKPAFDDYQKTLQSTSCERSSLYECFAKAETAIEYVSNPLGLTSQVGNLSYDSNRGIDNPIMFATTNGYTSLPTDMHPLITVKSKQLSRRSNEKENEKSENNLQFATVPIGLAEQEGKETRLASDAKRFLADARFPTERRSALEDELRKLQFNAALFDRTRAACRGDGSKCASEWDRLRHQTFAINESAIERPLRFADYCLARDSAAPWESAVAIILLKAATTDCLKAELWLESQANLSVRGAGLINISPLSWAPAAREIDLARNAISSLPLRLNWPSVTAVNLAHNQLIDVKSLQSIIGLKSLNLAFNSFTSFSWPARLNSIFLHGNSVTATSAQAINLVRNETEACQHELNTLVQGGQLSADIAKFYTEQDFGPELEWNGTARSFTGGFGICNAMIEDYD